MRSLIFDPPVSIAECPSAGRQLGEAWGTRSRVEFEQALIERLVAIDDLAPLSSDAEEALAAFDQAAWQAWEAAQRAHGTASDP